MVHVLRFAIRVLFYIATLLIAMGTLRAQDALPSPARPMPRLGGPQDWSARHIIYTRNGSAEDMMNLRDDPRFLHSILLRYAREHRNPTAESTTAGNESESNQNWMVATDSSSPDTSGDTHDFQPLFPRGPLQHPIPLRNKRSNVDWSVSLGPTGGLAIGETPAVYTYNYSTPSCSNLSATTPVIGDFAVYTINATPSTGQANLVGLTNLYTAGDGTGFCSGTGPSFLFSYAIGSGGSPLSPVLSLDGTKVAWIEDRSATSSYLHITIWQPNQGATATNPISPSGTFSNGVCTAGTSCDYAFNYSNMTANGCTRTRAANGHSDLYVDYASDAGFISANNGILYHIKNIFSTTANPTVDFCIPVNTSFGSTPSSAMSGPVYDPAINEVFITDSEKIYAYNVNTSATTPNFSLAASYLFGNGSSNYNYQTGPGPLLDPFNGYVYVFSSYDFTGHSSVTQLPTSLATGVPVEFGSSSGNVDPFLFYGAFDNNYYTYGPKSAASTLYSCGTDSSNRNLQDLFAISFNSTTGVVNTTPAMSNNTNVNPGGSVGLCSPITEFFDGTTDRIFVGMGQPGATTGANIVTMWNVTNQLTNTSGAHGSLPTYTAGATGYLGGTSGMAADNNSAGTAQAQSIYFSTEEAGASSTVVTGGGTGTTFNVNGIYTDGSTFPCGGGLDDDGNAYSSHLLGSSVTWNGTTFTFGPANAADAWQNTSITLPSGMFSTLEILAASVNGNLASQTFTVTYTDNSTTTLTQSVSDWYTPQSYPGESIALTTAYRNMCGGTEDKRTFDLYGYSFSINANKTVKSLTLPGPSTVNNANDNVVVVLGVALSANCGGQDYCAVKLTQNGLK
jgi:hypothetical protein